MGLVKNVKLQSDTVGLKVQAKLLKSKGCKVVARIGLQGSLLF